MLLLASPGVYAQGDGARNYQLVPDGTHSLTAFGIVAHGNQAADPSTVFQGSKIDAYLAVLQYSHAFALNGNQVQAFAMLPFGETRGTVPNPGGGTLSASASGLADAQIGAMLGVIGAPALPASKYAEFKPGFTLGALGKMYVPTGEYDSSRPVSMGANRWALQVGTPMAQYFGGSFLDSSLTSIEFNPSITFFTPNNAPFNAETKKQAPIAKFEGHVTRNVTPALWFSADAFHVRGGETTTDGASDNNKQYWWGVGGTSGIAFSNSVSGTITYGKVVRRNPPGVEAQAVRGDLMFAF